MAKGQMRSNKEKKKPKQDKNKKQKGDSRALAVRAGARPGWLQPVRQEGLADARSAAGAPSSLPDTAGQSTQPAPAYKNAARGCVPSREAPAECTVRGAA